MPPTAEAAKAFNRQLLRQTAAVLAGHAGGGHEYAFLCECGCEQTATLTLPEYDRRGGVWEEGHKQA
jgi:hypothetical protein